jgi:superfamily II DNA/RNA helicase
MSTDKPNLDHFRHFSSLFTNLLSTPVERTLQIRPFFCKTNPIFPIFHQKTMISPKNKANQSQFQSVKKLDSRYFGGVGLNLQNASAVVNMDLPWNPTVLEQRIGRIHRLGQHRPVRVVNFVSQGTIERGMLSLLSFKQSLFSGVLDKGKDEVFLGGTRLKRFMDSVDKAASAIPESMPQQAKVDGNGDGGEPEASVEVEKKELSEAAQQQTWDDIVSTGLSFLDKLGRTLLGEEGQPKQPDSKLSSRLKIETDKATGQRHLKLPIPKKETLQDIANLINEFSKRL